MNAHPLDEDRLLRYAAGQLDEQERAAVERHLESCPDCRAEVALWQSVGTEITAANAALRPPADAPARALARLHAPSALERALLRTFSLLSAQAYLVRRELWPSAAILMFMGIAATLLLERASIIGYFAPLVAAASLAVIFGPDHDPAYELALATPTSPWKVLLARLALVHGYNLTLTLAASLFLLLLVPPEMLGSFILGWLGPMTFLPALALLLSLWTGSGNSVAAAYALWLLQFIHPDLVPAFAAPWFTPVVEAYRHFWASPFLLLTAGGLLLAAALWSSGRMGERLVRSPL